MKKKTPIIIILVVVIIAACVGIAVKLLGSDHEHSFGEWETETPASCESAEVEARTCKCGEKETREGDPAAGHTYTSISAECVLEKPMEDMVLQASDISVTGNCGTCAQSIAITEGIELEGTALVLGENVITVKYGELSTTLTIQAAELNIALDGTVIDDTYIFSSNKDSENTDKKEMGTKSDLYRIYFRANISDILNDELFLKHKDNAKVQLVFAITSGSVTDETTFTLKAFTPAAGVTDVDFSELTWNSTSNKTGSLGIYNQLHWSNGTELVADGVGHNISAENGYITVTIAYSQIADFLDENGNILFVFASNTSGLKVGSLENKTETNRPAFKVVLNDEHFHVYDQETAEMTYLASAKCGEKAKYYKSCACGETGTAAFEYGGEIAHACRSISAEAKLTDPMASMVVKASDISVTGICGVCGESYAVTDGIKLEGATTLALGENKITVKYGKLSTTVTIVAEETGVILDGTVSGDTYVFSDSKDNAYADRTELGTNVKSFRSYLRVNISDILKNKEFLEYKNNAKVQLVFAVTSGSVTKDTTYTLKVYDPAAGATDAKFSNLTWNSVSASGKYSALNWSNGTKLSSSVDVKSGYIIVTVAYSQIENYVDSNGNILFAFTTNTSGLKVGSLENKTKSNRPAVKVILSDEHFHVFDQEVAEEKYFAAEAKCGEAAQYYLSCSCGEAGTDTFAYGEFTPHTYPSISAQPKQLANPEVGTVVDASYLNVTGTCDVCGESVTITDGIELEGDTTLAIGINTITVKYGELSTTVTIHVTEQGAAFEGTVTDDTYVSSGSKDKAYADGTELGTNVNSFRSYFRVNISDILNNAEFLENKDNATVQLILAITTGKATDDTIFTLKAYPPAAGVTDVDFSKLTWNSVNNKEGSVGEYSLLHWNNGAPLVSSGVGYNVSVKDGSIIITLSYSQIEDYVDENGNILFAFATSTSGLKVGSLENTTEANRPAFKIMLSGEHFHVFDDATCTAPKTCSICGATEGEALEHTWVDATCTTAKTCSVCGATEGEAPGHTWVDATCTTAKTCSVCGATEGEALGHTWTDADCDTPKTCSVCDETEGEALGHTWTDATCTTAKTCSVCDATEGEPAGHLNGETKIENQTNESCDQPGSYDEVVYCAVCGEELSRENKNTGATGHTPVTDAAVAPTCTDTGLTEGSHCSVCGEVLVKQTSLDALGHTWTDADCDSPMTCSVCGATEGEALGHTWTDATCTTAKTCSVCNETEGEALGHAMKTEYDENEHWTACGNDGCDETTEKAAHTGGTATETEQAVCEVCGQPYGELKQTESTAYIISGTILDDTYIDSGNQEKDYSTNKTLSVRTKNKTYYRAYFRYDFSESLSAAGEHKSGAKVQFTFKVDSGTITDATKFTFCVFNADETTRNVAFTDINWKSVKVGAAYGQLAFNENEYAVKLIDKKTMSEAGDRIVYEADTITITVDYDEISQYVDKDGKALFGLTTTSEDLMIASIEMGNTARSAGAVFAVCME